MACYDVCVVGAGLVGSAAAKWLSMRIGSKVCLIGPPEPTDQEWQGGRRQVFGAHYDEGRITREYDGDYIWGLLAQRSIQEYRSIERESGIPFYEEVGSVFIDDKLSSFMQDVKRNAEMLGVQHEIYCPQAFQTKFPYLRVDHNCECVWTPRKAGFINPRKLISAQHRIAEANGCKLVRDVVTKVCEEVGSGGGLVMKIVTESSGEIHARRVLLCAGAFINFCNLLPDSLTIDVSLLKTVVLKGEMTKEDVQKMSDMPSMVVMDQTCALFPPVKYPDGKHYLKIGIWPDPKNEIKSLEDAAKWFRSHANNDDSIKDFIGAFRKYLPEFKPVSLKTDCCLITTTPTGLFYCDMVSPRLGVMAGMNGVAAKSSNEVGRMGALMILKGAWDYDLPAHLFKLRYKNATNNSVSSKL